MVVKHTPAPGCDLPSLSPNDLRAATELVGRAFTADPFAIHAIPDERRRPRILASLFRTMLAGAMRYGRVHVDGPSLVGLAAWLPPGNELLTTGQLLRCGALRLPFAIPMSVLRSYHRYEHFAAILHQKLVPEPHWYLVPLAVEPEHQGRGHGSALLAAGLAMADEEGRACFLETQNPRNVPLYERHCFQVVEHTQVPSTDVGHWAMLRPARR